MSTATNDTPVCEAFYLMGRLALNDGVAPLSEYAGCWFRRVDDNWAFAVNGHKEGPLACAPPDMMEVEVKPYHAVVWFNGWLAAILNPRGGVFVAGSVGNEDNFIAAIRNAAGA